MNLDEKYIYNFLNIIIPLRILPYREINLLCCACKQTYQFILSDEMIQQEIYTLCQMLMRHRLPKKNLCKVLGIEKSEPNIKIKEKLHLFLFRPNILINTGSDIQSYGFVTSMYLALCRFHQTKLCNMSPINAPTYIRLENNNPICLNDIAYEGFMTFFGYLIKNTPHTPRQTICPLSKLATKIIIATYNANRSDIKIFTIAPIYKKLTPEKKKYIICWSSLNGTAEGTKLINRTFDQYISNYVATISF